MILNLTSDEVKEAFHNLLKERIEELEEIIEGGYNGASKCKNQLQIIKEIESALFD